MHANNLVVSVKSRKNGKFYKESRTSQGQDQVFVPFGDEYILYFKNLNSVKAVVSVEVDGASADSRRFIIEPNSCLELEGFESKHAFKFIEKTQKISDYRGDRADDSLIRVEYQFEEKVAISYPGNDAWISSGTWKNGLCRGTRLGGPSYTHTGSSFDLIGSVQAMNCVSAEPPSGITVKGSETDQEFVTGYTRTLDQQKHVIVLQLVGKKSTGEEVMVKQHRKQKCETCGTVNKLNHKFCRECGTALT